MGLVHNFEEIQNEKLYLLANKDSTIIKDIMNLADALSRLHKLDIYYKECIEDYQTFISLAAKLINELNIKDNSITLSMLIKTLISSGYFSQNNCFESIVNKPFYDLYRHEGMDIVNGKGCCRHFAAFYYDLFKELNLFNYAISCYLTTDITEDLEIATQKCSDHSISIISYDDTLYGYDCYSNILMNWVDTLTMQRIVPDKVTPNIKCFYKPSIDMIVYGISYDEMYQRLKLFKENSTKSHINFDKILEFKESANDIFNNNQGLFNDFKKETKTLTKRISDGLYLGKTEYIANEEVGD